MSAIPVEHADYCVNCDLVYDRRQYSNCPRCTSEAVMPLQLVTNPAAETKLGFDELDCYLTPLTERKE